MAGIKRKQAPNGSVPPIDARKKMKKGERPVKRSKTAKPPPQPASDSKSSSDSDTGDGGANLSSNDDAAIHGPSAQERGEAETDSDPIVESDTTEHSGEDDGVSWPSDGEKDKTVESMRPNGKAVKPINGTDPAQSTKPNGIPKASIGDSSGKVPILDD